MEPWVDSPTFFNLEPGKPVWKPCTLHVPGGTALNVRWYLNYGPDWMTIDALTGVLQGTPPDYKANGKFGVGVDYDFLPDTHEMVPGTNTMRLKGSGAPAARVKPSKPPKPPKIKPTKFVENANLYADSRDKFINSVKWDDDALAKMVDNVDPDGDIRDILNPPKPPGFPWRVMATAAFVAGFLCILVLLLVEV
jgi:hypothetical protein